MSNRRSQFRPSISQPHLFSPLPEKAHTEHPPPPRENQEEEDASSRTELKKSSTMASLGADFFKPPSANKNTGSGSDPHLPRKNARQRSSSAIQSPVRIVPRERKKKVKNESKPPREERARDQPGLGDADLPPSLLHKYESYIAKLHSHIKENQEDLPSEFRKLHEALQAQIAHQSGTGTVRLNSLTNLAQALGDTGAFWDMEQEASLLPFPASQHNYSHIRETDQWRRRQIFHGKWNADTAQGSFEEGKLWWKSPQFLLHCRAEKVNVRITLSQRDYHSPMGVYLFPATSLYRHIDLPMELVQSTPYQVTSRLKQVFELEGTGRGKPYVLMLCSQHAGSFKLTVESKEDVKVSNVGEWEEWQVQDRWEAHCAGGCVNNDSYPDNPQYLLSSNSPDPVQCQATLHYRGAVERADDLGLQLLEPSGSDSDPGRLRDRKDAKIVEKSGFSSLQQATLYFELERGQPRLLIPCTFDKGVLAHFELDIFSASPLKVTKLSKPNASDVKGEWDGAHAGGCFNYASWIDNPQYQVTLTRPCRIQLTQENTSSSIGFYLAKSEGQRLLTATWDTFTLKSKFINQPSVSVHVNVTEEEASAGGVTYTIIPCTFYPGQLGTFRLQAFQQSTPAEIKPASDPYHQTVATGKWSFDTAGGCFNSATWRNNPQYELSLPTDSPVTLLVEQTGDQPPDTIGCYIIETDEPDSRVWQDPKDQKLLKKIPFERHTTGACTFQGRADRFYTIIPCTYQPGKCRSFRLRVFTTECQECDLTLLDNPALDAGRLCEGEWTHESGGGSMNNTTWPNNPHYLLYTDEQRAHSITLVLTQRDQDDEDGWLPIGLSVTRADVHGLPALTCPEDIVASAPYEEARDIMVTLDLPQSERPFVLTPSTFSPGQLGRFIIQVFTDPEADIMLMPWHSDISFDEDDDEVEEESDEEEWEDEDSSSRASAAASPMASQRALSPFRDAPWKNHRAPSTPSRPSPLVDDESRRVMFQDAHADDESDTGDVEELRNEILILKDRLEYLTEEVDQHEQETDALHEEIAALKEQVHQLETALAEKETELQKLQESHSTQQTDRENEWNSHRTEMETQLAQAKEENDKLQSTVATKDEELQQAQEQATTLEKQTVTLQEQLEEARESLTTLTAERDQLTQSHQEHEERRSQADSREQELSQQIDELTKQVTSFEEQLATLQGEKELAQQQVQHHQEQEEELNTEIQHLRQQVEAKQAELSHKMGEMQDQELTASELEEKCALTAHALEDMTQQADQAEERVAQLKKRVDAKNEKITALQSSQRETTDRYEALCKEHETLTHEHESLQTKVSDLTTQLEQLTEDHSKGTSRVTELEGLSQAAETKMNALVEERDALAQEKEEHAARIQELEEKLQAMEEDQSAQSQWKEQVETLEEKLQDLQKSLEESQAHVQQKQEELDSLQSQWDEAQAQHQEELTQLKKQLDQASSQPPPSPETPATPESKPRELPTTTSAEGEEEGEDSHKAPPPAPKENDKAATPPPAAPTLPSLSDEDKKQVKENSPFRGTATISRSKRKKKSILTAIRGGVNLRKVKPENAGEKMKNNWVPFNVDKIIQRRHAMEEPVESNWSDDEDAWSDSDSDSWE